MAGTEQCSRCRSGRVAGMFAPSNQNWWWPAETAAHLLARTH
ncbi:trp operon leader peptide [Streptomyces sp. F63]|nr:trp operon leader peptide [Streptomyces sp. F63]